MSGGSIRHPHSQIIGLEDYDYHEDITAQNMEGWLLYEDQDVRITLSTHPIIGFFEYNIRFKPDAPVRSVALRLQQVLRYVLRSIANYSQSYNYFVYNLEDGYDYIKVVARYVTTPLYVGYKFLKLAMKSALQKSSKTLRRTSTLQNSFDLYILYLNNFDIFERMFMKVFAIGDLHLSGNPPTKPMDILAPIGITTGAASKKIGLTV